MGDAAAIIRERRVDERMKGDPRVAAGGVAALEACLYAAALLRKRGAIPMDASDLDGKWALDIRTATFWRAGALIAAYRVPDHVMDYDPLSAVTEIKDEQP